MGIWRMIELVLVDGDLLISCISAAAIGLAFKFNAYDNSNGRKTMLNTSKYDTVKETQYPAFHSTLHNSTPQNEVSLTGIDDRG
jgi:hypothetical protein